LKKVQSLNERSLKEMISARKSFGLETTYKGKTSSFENAITLYQNGGVGYIKESEINTNIGIIKLYKTLIPPLGSGSDSFPHPILGKPFVVEPNSACTETYLVAGVFKNRKEAENLAKYLTTRFLRFLVLLSKPTQHATSKVYTFAPIQDFKETWSDEKLYNKYGITDDEINFIESLVRPMNSDDD
jgi:site-specific DNA-methyltransferase (adenine-specific)